MFDKERFIEDCRAAVRDSDARAAIRELVTRAVGAPVVDVATHVLEDGVYLPPELTSSVRSYPPQAIICVPVQTAEW